MNPSTQNLVLSIKKLIAQGLLDEALEKFENTAWAGQALIYRSILSNLKLRKDQGQFHNGEYEVELTRLLSKINQLLINLENGLLPPNEEGNKLRQKERNSRRIFKYSIIGVLILVFVQLFILNKVPKIFESLNSIESVKAPNLSFFHIDSAYHILLLPFGPDGICKPEKNQYHWQVERRLGLMNRQENLNLEIVKQDTLMCNHINPDSVRSYGKRHGADLVVYGDYQERCEWDTTLLTVRYVLIDTILSKDSKKNIGQEAFSVRDVMSLQDLRNGRLTGGVEDILFWVLGLRAYNEKEYRKSLAYFEKVNLKPGKEEFIGIFWYRAACNYFLDQLAEAKECLNKAIKLDSSYARAYNSRGVIQKRLKKFKLALKDYSKAIAIDPEFSKAYFNRGTLYLRLKDYKKAQFDYSKAIELSPYYVNAYYNRGLSSYYLGEFDHSISDYSKAIELNSKYTNAYIGRGGAYAKKGKLANAIINYDSAIFLDPTNATAYANRGEVFELLGDKSRAQYDYSIRDSLRNLIE